MAGIPRDGIKRVQVGVTVSAENAAKLSLQANKSEVVDSALTAYFELQAAAPRPEPDSSPFYQCNGDLGGGIRCKFMGRETLFRKNGGKCPRCGAQAKLDFQPNLALLRRKAAELGPGTEEAPPAPPEEKICKGCGTDTEARTGVACCPEPRHGT